MLVLTFIRFTPYISITLSNLKRSLMKLELRIPHYILLKLFSTILGTYCLMILCIARSIIFIVHTYCYSTSLVHSIHEITISLLSALRILALKDTSLMVNLIVHLSYSSVKIKDFISPPNNNPVGFFSVWFSVGALPQGDGGTCPPLYNLGGTSYILVPLLLPQHLF